MLAPSSSRAHLGILVAALLAAVHIPGYAAPAVAQEPDPGGEVPGGAADPIALPETVVTATRSAESIATIPGSVTVVTREQIEAQATPTTTLGDVLGKLVPGLAPGSQSQSVFGQTLRGRNVLVLIDGVPQSTTRNVSRDLTTIDPSAVERVEVIRGATAIYGDGATGGIVNIITRAPAGERVAFGTDLGLSVSLTHPGDSLGGRVGQRVSGSTGRFDFLVSGAFEHTGGLFDARGDRIPPDPHGQGGFADTNSGDLLGKIGVEITPGQRLSLTANHFTSRQVTDFASDPSVNAFPPRSHKARAIEGLALDDRQGTVNTVVSLGYTHKELLGSRVEGQLYYRDYLTRFFPFDGRAFAVFGNTIYQSRLESDKTGGRLSAETPLAAGLTVLWGVDAARERTSQPVTIMDPAAFDASGGLVFVEVGERTWVPTIEQGSLGLFSQLEWQATSRWILRGGIRHERIGVEVDDFTTLAGASVRGGDLDYSATLYNAGVVFSASEAIDLFANVSQGFSLPDLGLILRGAPDGSSVETLNTAPQKVDMYEVGVRGTWPSVDGSLSLFYNESDLGTSSGGFNAPVVRAPERVYGLEATLDTRFLADWQAGTSVTWLEGERDPDLDGHYTYLNSFRIPPIKVTAYLEHETRPGWRNRLQALYSGSRGRFGTSTAFGERPLSSYVVLDLISQVEVGPGTLTLAVENLLNRQYFTRESQLLRTGRNDSYAAAEGASLAVAYSVRY
ncbi:MAG TPA: TonB-dependent receptor [Thermodesulfobacteriota bacterium]